MNTKKTIGALTATGLIIGQVGQLAVLANDDVNAPKQLTETTNSKTKKEMLEEIILESKQKEEALKKDLDKAQSEYDESVLNKSYIEAKYNEQEKQVTSYYSNISDDLKNSLSENCEQLEKSKKELENLEKDFKEKLDNVNDLEKKLENAQNKLEDAKKKLESAKENSEKITPEGLEKAKNEMETAKTELLAAETEVSDLQKQLLDSENKKTELQSAFDKALSDYQSAQILQSNAQAEYDAAVTRYEEAEKAYNEKNDEKGELNNELQVLNEDLKLKQESLNSYNNELSIKQNALQAKQDELNSINNQIEELNSKIQEQENIILQKDNHYKNLLWDYNYELEYINNFNTSDEKKKLEDAVTEAQKNVDYWTQQVIWDNESYSQAKSDLKTARANVEIYKEEGLKAIDNLNKGSLSLFEDLKTNGNTEAERDAAKEAVDVLNNAKYASYTQIGDETDATEYNHMGNALNYITSINKIREELGLCALKVNYVLMAIAQSDANYSSENLGHAKQYNVGENLAWESKVDDVNQLYGLTSVRQWYDDEKAVYDYIKNSTKYTLEAVSESDELKKQVAKDLNIRVENVQWGHYLNIINPDYTLTGFAISCGTINGREMHVSAQVFGMENLDYDLTNKSLKLSQGIDIDTFGRDIWSKYLQDQQKKKSEYVCALQQQKDAEDKMVESENWHNYTMEMYNRALEDKKIPDQNLKNAMDAYNDRLAALPNKKANVDAAKLEYDNACNDLQTLKDNMSALNNSIEQTNNDIVGLNDAITGLNTNIEENRNDITLLNNQIKSKNEEHFKVNSDLLLLKNEQEQSEALMAKAEQNLVNQNLYLNLKESDYLKKKQLLDKQTETVELQNETLNNKINDLDYKQSTFDSLALNYENLVKLIKAHEECELEVNNLKDECDLLENSKSEALNDLTQLSTEKEIISNELSDLNSVNINIKKLQKKLNSVRNNELVDYCLDDDNVVVDFTAKLKRLSLLVNKEVSIKKELSEASENENAKLKKVNELKAEYNKSIRDYNAAVSELSDYLQKVSEESVSSNKIQNNTVSSKQDTTNTGVSTSIGVYALTGLISLAGATYFAKHAKKD